MLIVGLGLLMPCRLFLLCTPCNSCGMRGGIIGRERELGAAVEFAAELERGPAGLVFAGKRGLAKQRSGRR
jgi:hypothetical protein